MPLPASGTASPESASISTQTQGQAQATTHYEYSAREVKPATLLLQDLLRAHSVFLLHHASSLSALFVRVGRDGFISLLGRYWDLFLSTWNVLLHGNPASAVFGGIKAAACGELGFGVGEEERGSGERDVLEALVGRTDGLVDLVVGRFGNDDDTDGGEWLGACNEPGAEDGAVFLGVGALSRASLRAVTYWMEDIYSWGENAYGVLDRPTSMRGQKRRRAARKAAAPGEQASVDKGPTGHGHGSKQAAASDDGGSMDKLFGYLKMGYGTSWSLGGSSPTAQQAEGGIPGTNGDGSRSSPQNTSLGRFLIGLIGDIESPKPGDGDNSCSQGQEESKNTNSRTVVRTLWVELETGTENRSESSLTRDLGSHDTELAEQRVDTEGNATEEAKSSFDSQDRNKSKKVRVVVYVAKPFLFVFLFQPRTDSLEWEGTYRSLHAQLTPIRKPLVSSTAYRPERPDLGSVSAQIYDLIWDPRSLTVHSTIPNIPDPPLPGMVLDATSVPVWTRAEALNTHNQILNMFMATRENTVELERTCKTSRGWWVVWNRILERPPGQRAGSERLSDVEETGTDTDSERERKVEQGSARDLAVDKEIFLIRRASDNAGTGIRSVSSLYVGGGGWADGASRLAQGIGVDTRRYIEGLLSLNQ